MAEPSKNYAEGSLDKPKEVGASEPAPVPRTPETPPQEPPLRIQVDGRETGTQEPRIVGGSSTPPPPIIQPTATSTPDQQPEQSPQTQGQNKLAILLGVLAIVALLLWLVAGAPPIGSALQESLPKLLPRPAARSTTSPDNLYRFTIVPPIVDGVTFTGEETTGDCEGTMFTSDPSKVRSGATVYPFLRVCFLGFDTGNPPNDLQGQLQARADHAAQNDLTEAREGLIRHTEIGQDRMPGQEVYIRGQDREIGKEIEWYESTVQYADRFYAIEAADLASNWEQIWPALSASIASLQFASGVVTPAKAPIIAP
jgi:hypothetical protein